MIKINNTTYQKPLFVFAMEAEAGTEFVTENVVFTGIGKVNATYHLMKGIQHFQPDVIINLGTAGSTVFDRGSVICCTSFIQRDMEATALGFQAFETPFEKDSAVLKYGLSLAHLPQGTCGSGDCFETEHTHSAYQVIDMEAYALAKVARNESIPFLCLKYISDGADDDAVSDWNEEVKKAAKVLKQALQ